VLSPLSSSSSLFTFFFPAPAPTELYTLSLHDALPILALVAIGIVGIWSSLGFNIIVLGAGLRSIPGEMYEAARIDGATNWRQLISITVPLLSPSIFFLTVLSVIHGMELFDLIFIMIGESNPIRGETQSMVSL